MATKSAPPPLPGAEESVSLLNALGSSPSSRVLRRPAKPKATGPQARRPLPAPPPNPQFRPGLSDEAPRAASRVGQRQTSEMSRPPLPSAGARRGAAPVQSRRVGPPDVPSATPEVPDIGDVDWDGLWNHMTDSAGASEGDRLAEEADTGVGDDPEHRSSPPTSVRLIQPMRVPSSGAPGTAPSMEGQETARSIADVRPIDAKVDHSAAMSRNRELTSEQLPVEAAPDGYSRSVRARFRGVWWTGRPSTTADESAPLTASRQRPRRGIPRSVSEQFRMIAWRGMDAQDASALAADELTVQERFAEPVTPESPRSVRQQFGAVNWSRAASPHVDSKESTPREQTVESLFSGLDW